MDTKSRAETQIIPVGPQSARVAGVPKGWNGRLAYVVSMVGSPPVLAGATIALLAASLPSPHVWLWAGLQGLLAVLAPVLAIIWLVHVGRLTDLDVQLREQRPGPLVLTILCAGLTWLLLALGAAPRPLVALAAVMCLQSILLLAITLRWKISMHTTVAAGAATVIWSLIGTPLGLLVGVPLIAWSRVRLRRHTLAQTVAGSLLGLGVSLVALPLLR